MDPAQILALLERRDVHVERERGGPQVWHIENSRTGTTVRHESLATAVAAFVALNSPLYDPARRPE